ncbi:MAG: ion transporter [Cecembia sp.]
MIIKKLFLKDSFILLIILLNALIIFISGFEDLIDSYPQIILIDNLFTLLFIFELTVKLNEWGPKKYFSDNWNIFDFILIILAIPSLVYYLFDFGFINLNFLLVFRILRVFKFFRFIRFIPNIDHLLNGVLRAGRASVLIIVGFLVFNFTVSLFTTFLFKDLSSEYFGNPIISFYSTFKIFTVEGWYDIPDSISEDQSAIISFLVRLYFVVILFFGGIFGLSLVNSIFVDAMISDNNTELEEQVQRLEKKIDFLSKKLDQYFEKEK